METARAEINRENAQHSTGPVTAAGKQRSKFNARRHNLTGQTIMGTAEEMAIYAAKCEALRNDLRPEGAFETSLVQSMADSQFQLERARAIETNLFFELSILHLDSPASNGGDLQHPTYSPARPGGDHQPPIYSPARQGGDSQHPNHSPASNGGDHQPPNHSPARQGGDHQPPTYNPARQGGDSDDDPTLDWARAQARAFLENGKHFDLLGR